MDEAATPADDVTGVQQLTSAESHPSPKTTQRLVSRTRWIKFINTLVFLALTCVVLLAANTEDSTGYHLTAYMLALVYGISVVYFSLILFGSRRLHYLYVKRRSIAGLAWFVCPSGTVEEHTRTIKSVSALTATFGSNAHGLFSRMSYASVGAVLTAIIVSFKDPALSLRMDATDQAASLLMLCGMLGNVLYGTWELEGPNNVLSTTMHYACAPLIFCVQTLAYCIQQRWNAHSTLMFCVGMLLDAVYVVILYRLPETSDDASKVHRISLICICTEFAALIVPCFAVVAFVYNL